MAICSESSKKCDSTRATVSKELSFAAVLSKAAPLKEPPIAIEMAATEKDPKAIFNTKVCMSILGI